MRLQLEILLCLICFPTGRLFRQGTRLSVYACLFMLWASLLTMFTTCSDQPPSCIQGLFGNIGESVDGLMGLYYLEGYEEKGAAPASKEIRECTRLSGRPGRRGG